MMRPEIKICGITAPEEIEKLRQCSCDYAGFVLFFPRSRRNIEPDLAGKLIERAGSLKTVAVVVSPTLEQVREIEKIGFDIIQIHGELDDGVKSACRLPIWRACNIKDEADVRAFKAAAADARISAVVTDAPEYGSGLTFDWEKVRNVRVGGKKLIMAGGLNPDNVGEAISFLHPDVVDVSSGVEYDDRSKRGKDLNKIEQFAEAVRKSERKEENER